MHLLKPSFTFKSETTWIWIILAGPLILGSARAVIDWLIRKVFEF